MGSSVQINPFAMQKVPVQIASEVRFRKVSMQRLGEVLKGVAADMEVSLQLPVQVHAEVRIRVQVPR